MKKKHMHIFDSQNKHKLDDELLTDKTFIYYYTRLCDIAMSVFEWNLPDTCDTRYLELQLLFNGYCLFFKDEVLNEYLTLPCTFGGRYNVYNIPTVRMAYAPNGYKYECTIDNSVIIYNNYMRTPFINDVVLYASRLTNLERTIDVNLNAQKTPILITCEENQKLTLLNVYKQYQDDAPVIYGYKGFNPDSVRVLKTDAPYVSDKIQEQKKILFNEFLTHCGIPNMSYEKKERVFTDEVERTQGGVFAEQYVRLNTRKSASAEINRMYNLDTNVKYKDSFNNFTDGQESDIMDSDRSDLDG